MADEQTDAAAETAESSGKGSSKLLIIGGAVAVLAAGLAIGGFMSGMFSSGEDAGTEAAAEPDVDDRPALYVGLHPPLTVNFGGDVGQRHFMQVSLEFLARDQEIVDAVKEHDAVIRNSLLLLLGGYDYQTVTTRAGKEQVLEDVLFEVQGILSARIGEPGVEEVYFTTLVVQ